MKLRVLIISRSAWNETNSNGNTLSSIFQTFSSDELAQIYCRDEIPDNKLCKKYFRISERQLIKSILGFGKIAGEELDISQEKDSKKAFRDEAREKNIYDFFLKFRWFIFLWLREFIWCLGRWKSKSLVNFIREFSPTVIFTESSDSYYMYSLLKFARKTSGVPVAIFHCDDQATFRQFSISPFFWIHRIILRTKLKEAVRDADINYCIIDKQQEVYKKIFKKDFRLLHKCADFSVFPKENTIKKEGPIQVVYTGNIFYSRWKTLAKVAKVIDKTNKGETKVLLKIYTANSPSKRILKALNFPNSVKWMGKIPYNEIPKVLEESDVLLHVESFNIKQRLITALSFSTKLVDYFKAARCIFAIGWNSSSSIEYLRQSKSAIVISDLSQIEPAIRKIIDNPSILTEYSIKGFEFGKKNHDHTNVLKSFRNDLVNLSIKD